jgi:DNA-binding CsgD family transcriptional regulator
MPNSRQDPTLPIAGEWRASLRRDAGDATRLRCLLAAADALPSIADPAQARQRLLAAALSLHAARDGVVLGLRGDRWQVLAAEGRALPPGASLPGGWPGAPADVIAARATRALDWWMGARAPMRMIEAPIAIGGETHGVLSIAIAPEAPSPEDDRRALGVLAAMLAPHVAAPPQTPRRARRGADPRLARLTRRERQVLALLPRGLTNAALAEELGIAPGTAKVHVERILHKLALADRTQAAVFAMRQGVAT